MAELTRKMMVAANWKMNGRQESVENFSRELSQINTTGEIVFSPPALYLSNITAHNYSLAAQTGCAEMDGALTGEVSMPMIADCGCRYVIVGHSERRTLYKEQDNDVFAKVEAAFTSGLTPILCIGETDEENLERQTEAVLERQLKQVVKHLSTTQKQSLVIAYEPVWAIGTGRIPSINNIESIHQKIRYLFSKNDDTISSSVRILYGGSVKPDNAKEIFACPNVDGGLVGVASLTIESFKEIIKAMQ